jgi:hypothetical protein
LRRCDDGVVAGGPERERHLSGPDYWRGIGEAIDYAHLFGVDVSRCTMAGLLAVAGEVVDVVVQPAVRMAVSVPVLVAIDQGVADTNVDHQLGLPQLRGRGVWWLS